MRKSRGEKLVWRGTITIIVQSPGTAQPTMRFWATVTSSLPFPCPVGNACLLDFSSRKNKISTTIDFCMLGKNLVLYIDMCYLIVRCYIPFMQNVNLCSKMIPHNKMLYLLWQVCALNCE